MNSGSKVAVGLGVGPCGVAGGLAAPGRAVAAAAAAADGKDRNSRSSRVLVTGSVANEQCHAVVSESWADNVIARSQFMWGWGQRAARMVIARRQPAAFCLSDIRFGGAAVLGWRASMQGGLDCIACVQH